MMQKAGLILYIYIYINPTNVKYPYEAENTYVNMPILENIKGNTQYIFWFFFFYEFMEWCEIMDTWRGESLPPRIVSFTFTICEISLLG